MFGSHSVMNMFRSPAAATPEVTQEMQQQQQAAQGQTTNGLPVTPANPAADPTQVEEQVSPLDAYKDLWENKPPAEGSSPEFDPSNMFNTDPAKMREAMQQIDFTKSINPADMEQVLQGGEGAVKALVNILNSTNRETLNAAIMASANMVQSGFTRAVPALDGRVNRQVRDHQVTSQLQETNPALNHPAAQPMIQAVKAQLLQKYPQASSAEITRMTNEYVGGFAATFAAKPEATPQSSSKETDWSQYMS